MRYASPAPGVVRPWTELGISFFCRHAGAWLGHNALRSVVGRIATAAGFTFRFEDHLESGERPGDLLIESWEAGRDCAVDVTCVHALNLSANWISDAAAVDLAEQAKDTHYATECEQAGLCWTPAGMDLRGRNGPRCRCWDVAVILHASSGSQLRVA